MKKQKNIKIKILDLGITEEHLSEDTLFVDPKKKLNEDEGCLFEKLEKINSIEKNLVYNC